jgi:hypothetical protein
LPGRWLSANAENALIGESAEFDARSHAWERRKKPASDGARGSTASGAGWRRGTALALGRILGEALPSVLMLEE